MNVILRFVLGLPGAFPLALAAVAAEPPRPVFVIPNFHPASCGWLTDWSTERNYCANSYFDHLDRVRDDPTYSFALSECNNMIAMLNFAPQRFAELKQRIREGRVEPCNAFFLEPTINLSGGEALVKCGVEGLRWQQAMLGVRPRLAWMIDVTGLHEQMAQITAGLGLDGFVYCRHNPTGYAIHWAESPDGTRALAVAPGRYSDWQPVFKTAVPLTDKQLAELHADLKWRAEPTPLTPEEIQKNARPSGGEPRRAPAGAPLLLFGGNADYSLAPLYKSYPGEFLPQFRKIAPEFDVQFATPGRYLDVLLPGLRSGAIQLPVMRGGSIFNYNAFWIQNPRVKSWFRRCEQQLQAAEMLATAASLRGSYDYPTQALYHAWLLLCLNMDRNTLWGAAGGMVFEHERSWDARDRFEWIEKTARDIVSSATRSLLGAGNTVVRFNPLNWQRHDWPELSGYAMAPESKPAAAKETAFPGIIETKFYSARLDPATGALVSLKLKSSDRELLGGPANVIVAEQPKKKLGGPADHMVDRPDRERVADSSQSAPRWTVRTSAAATMVEAESTFVGGGRLRRMMTFYRDHPRIDFETELNDLPDRTIVVAEFPLAGPVHEVRRGIPYGFAHAAWATPNAALPGFAKGITPAVRWSHYQMAGGGVALLDQGLTGREITGNTPIIYLYNAAEKYRGHPNAWLSGAGRHVLRYALVAHAGDFATAQIPQQAWEFNSPPLVVADCAQVQARPFVQTSDNVIVEALRREGGEIELRLAECVGRAGTASVTLNLPHRDAALTDLVGGRRQAVRGGPQYTFLVRPQQIVTMRFRTAAAVADIKPLTEWDELVPAHKRDALRRYLPDVKGHPPAGGN
jgi:alpha-mannosidase